MSKAPESTSNSEKTEEVTRAEDDNPNAPVDAREERDIADANDIGLAVRHHRRSLARVGHWFEGIFHYFFVGSVSIATLTIAFLIPLAMMAAMMTLLITPAYVVYILFRSSEKVMLLNENKYLLASLMVITVYWAGYFFQHGWPRMRKSLHKMYAKAAPFISWALTTLNRYGDEDESPAANQRSRTEEEDDLMLNR